MIYFFFYLLTPPADFPLFARIIIYCFGTIAVVGVLFCCALEMGIKLPKRKVPDWLREELAELEKLYKTHKDHKDKDSRQYMERMNSRCPKCSGEKIVDKISQTKGVGEGSFLFGCGSASGRVDTEEVNHCSSCGHEWKKDRGWSSSDSAMDDLFKGMYDFFRGGKDNQSDDLKKFYAKTILHFLKKHTNINSYKLKELLKLSVRDLRKYGCK